MSNAIRRFTTGYIESIKDKLYKISDYLYENPELSLREEKAYNLLTGILKDENFEIIDEKCIQPYSFLARYGDGKTNIGYILEYSSSENGHISGHNIGCGINIGAAIGLKRAIDQIGGCVTVIGCSGDEVYNPTKIKMLQKGVFDKLDAVICAHPFNKTCESGSSLGMKEINIRFESEVKNSYFSIKDNINALSPFIELYNLIEDIKKNHCRGCFINPIITGSSNNLHLPYDYIECSVIVKSTDNIVIENISNMIKESLVLIGKNNKCKVKYNHSDIEYLPFKTNQGISRNICHNLKESGIINIHGKMTMPFSLDLGNVSHLVPCVQPYIGICKDNISYYTREFSYATREDFAKEMMIKAACSLSLTGVDIIQCPSIIDEK